MHFDSESTPGFAIGRVAYLMRTRMAAVLKQADWPFTPEETQTLVTLADVGEPLSMSDLASRMVRDPTTVKRQLDRLVERKFIKRSVSPKDARIVMVGLTARGEQQLQTVLPLLDELRKCALQGITKTQVTEIQKVLQKMQSNLANHKLKD
ncbi:MarR family winged helix-turn-helix transcriptional regulator [Rhodopirellula bahusiensis]|uniref:DNA-binding protein n=1 Tax=Rhodopirellula bahusiensis TaxID=2014065 RepID=A0A2G1W1B9_9BACT|nr:MarR family transcriptional regulator [Rhodopirellula bahusiensis]PHQ32771.1 DNA-binding protein [Rhodopirellula bahusiensis]